MSISLIVLFVSFLGLIALSLPVTFSIGISSLLALVVDGRVPLQLIPQRLFVSLDSFTLMAIPLFILAGDLMMVGGISKRLINLAKVMVGWMSGGLAYVTFVASAMFGAISGSAVATCTAIGGMMYPELIKDKYEDPFAAAICATSGTLGVLIPPSIAFLLFGTTTNTSVSDLFAGGAIVGTIGMFGYCIAVYFRLRSTKVKPLSTKKPTLGDATFAIKDAFWGLLSPVIILGGIYSGKFTPTEAAVVSIVYSIIVTVQSPIKSK
jgi:C4-dicarboxylate transporter DctM subunit